MNDSYFHTDNNIIYSTASILGPKENTSDYEKLNDDYNSQFKGCDCSQKCKVSTCDCLQRSRSINYEEFTSDGETTFRIKTKPIPFNYPIYECHSNCTCSTLCGNRVVQKGPIEGLKVFPCENKRKGLGLFTLQGIPKDTFICEYAGELLTKTQALGRIKENESKNKMNYIFCLNEYSSMQITQIFVDPSQLGNIGRYINHSCDPNCDVIPVRYDSLVPLLAIFSCRDIIPHEEITFHYGTTESKDDVRLKNGAPKNDCLCNTEKCKGFLPSNNF